MEIFNDNPLAVLHLLCALVALVSGFTARIYGWRGRPPGGAISTERRASAVKRPHARRPRPAMRWLPPVALPSLCRAQAV
jgi:hypothetical protein